MGGPGGSSPRAVTHLVEHRSVALRFPATKDREKKKKKRKNTVIAGLQSSRMRTAVHQARRGGSAGVAPLSVGQPPLRTPEPGARWRRAFSGGQVFKRNKHLKAVVTF